MTDIYITPDSDFIIQCSDIKFHVSKFILAFHSPVWSAMLQDVEATEVTLPEDTDGLHQVLLLCHNYEIKVNQSQLRSMLSIGFKYDIKCILEYCETHIKGKPLDILTLGDKYHSVELLQRSGRELIKNHNASQYSSLDKSTLLHLLKQYDEYAQSLESTIKSYQSLVSIRRKKKLIRINSAGTIHSDKF